MHKDFKLFKTNTKIYLHKQVSLIVFYYKVYVTNLITSPIRLLKWHVFVALLYLGKGSLKIYNWLICFYLF